MLEFSTNSNNSTFPGFELEYEGMISDKLLLTSLTLRGEWKYGNLAGGKFATVHPCTRS